jgi:hypothetical protein
MCPPGTLRPINHNPNNQLNMNKRIFTIILTSLTLSLARLQAEVPQMIHYHGYVTVSGQPFTGTGQFKFVLVDKPGTNSYWSHDGTSVSGAAPTNTIINLPVFRGLYSVLLGDRSVNGMTQTIPTSVFADHGDVFLRVWFDDGVNGLQQLAPDTPIASVGFAMVAAAVCDGSVNSAALAPNLSLGGNATAGTLTLKSGGDQTRAVLDAGTQSGFASLKLFDATGAFDTVRLVGDESGNGGGQLLLKNGSGNTTLEFDAQDGSSTNAGGVVRLKKNDGKNVLVLDADIGSGNSGLLLFDANGSQETLRLSGAEDGTKGAFLGLKNTNGNATIQLRAQETDGTSASLLQMKRNNGTETATLRSEYGATEAGALLLGNSSGNSTVELAGDGGESQGRLLLKHSNLATRVKLDGDGINNGGQVDVYNAESDVTVSLAGELGSDQGGLLLYANDILGAHETVRLTGAYQGTGAGYMQFKNRDDEITVKINADQDGEGVITTQVLTITGGSDLSEKFQVSANIGSAEPGMIVCIDPERPGELRVSNQPYDPTVAGIISGAGGVKPGLLMGQHGTVADGKHAVALSGRVFCYVDAGYGAVNPGDLITTSATPGHGMKADSARAAGAVLGKAMTPLKEGHGLVLVLVSLQ